ncbi:MAG: hypothetical protein H8K06_06570 [Nitrospira sp.]|uniref:Uncharacterized protein n=1 Tax=Nitrospira defluvii TaxID=330214 RepID=A0ABM8QUE2_9BACT|nr:hypothetical protein [Nitrospira defluvii]MCS6326740.1 hypothetical protein [Nitrospira sp.]CAE6715767.1 conserved exported hypothetical protein [Nitrospira defluvii]
MRSIGIRKASTGSALLVTALLHVGGVGAALADSPATDAPAWTELRTQALSDGSQAPAATSQRPDLFRQSPTLSGQIRVSEQTLIPYIGAGFGGGYVTERDRALNLQPVLPQQSLFGDSMGKSMMPNEFQMGIRIPF